MNFIYKIFVNYFLIYKDDNLSKKKRKQIADLIVFHNSKIPDYLSFGIKLLSCLFVLLSLTSTQG